MKAMGKGLVLGIIVAALGVNGPVSGAERLKMGPKKVEPVTSQQFSELRSKLGTCIVKSNRTKVAKYLANSDSMTIDYAALDTDLQRFFFYFNMQSCMKYNVPQMQQSVFMAPGGLRNLLLEAAYLDAQSAAPKALLDEKGEPALASARTFPTKGDNLAAVMTYAALADCVAAKDSALADAVLRTGFGLPDERQAAIALAPAIGTCVREGANISLTPASIRTLAAEGMWHRYAHAANAAVASVK